MAIEDYSKYKDARVLIGTPNYTNLLSSEVHTNHVECAVAWTRWGLKFNWTLVGRTFVHFARTQISQAAIAGEFTHILWLDDDAVADPEILPRFIEHDVDVVIAPYPMRRPGYEIGVLKSTNGNFHDHASYRNLSLADLGQGMIEVDGGGTHCMLVKVECMLRKGSMDPALQLPEELRKLLSSLDSDQQKMVDHYIGNMPTEELSLKEEDDLGKPYFMMPKSGTEDMYWCYRAKKKGVKIWCDTDVFADHIGFAPRITKSFRAQYEKWQSDGSPVDADSTAIAIQPVGSGRNSRAIKKNADVNLV